MLTLHDATGEVHPPPADLGGAALPPGIVWIDLLAPSPDETEFVEHATGLHLPSFAELSEIETSSRLRAQHGVLYLSAPLVHRAIADDPLTTPVGFILGPELLVTVRFEELTSFATFGQTVPGTASEAFVGLVEAIVDRNADILEHIAAELDTLSHRLFRSGPIEGGRHRRPATRPRICALFCAGSGPAAISPRRSATASWASRAWCPMSKAWARRGFPRR